MLKFQQAASRGSFRLSFKGFVSGEGFRGAQGDVTGGGYKRRLPGEVAVGVCRGWL